MTMLLFPRTLIATAIMAVLAALAIDTFALGDVGAFIVMLAGMFLISLTDREGFYGDRPLGPPRAHR